MHSSIQNIDRPTRTKIDLDASISACETDGARPKIILCVAASDAHVVGNHMIAMFLRDNGVDVINLGAATPIEEMMEAYQMNQDVLAIVIGSMNGHAVDDLAGLGNAKRDYQVRCPIFLGGNLSVGSQKTSREIESMLNDGVSEIVRDPERLLMMLKKLAKKSIALA
jgi:methylaspartate mutase sigma subunit